MELGCVCRVVGVELAKVAILIGGVWFLQGVVSCWFKMKWIGCCVSLLTRWFGESSWLDFFAYIRGWPLC